MTSTDQELEQIRALYNLRELTEEEEGLGIDDQPNGVYGFTYSPAADNFPLFRKRLIRSFEAHKRQDGSTYLVGYLTPEDAARMKSGGERSTIRLLPEPLESAPERALVPMNRVIGHREHSQREGRGLELHLRAP